jgi:hypothetical protein
MSATQTLSLLRSVTADNATPWLLLVDDQVYSPAGLAEVLSRSEVQSLTWWLPEADTYHAPRLHTGKQALEPFAQAMSLQIASDAFLSVEPISAADKAADKRVNHFELQVTVTARRAKTLLASLPAKSAADATVVAPASPAAPTASPVVENRFPTQFAAAQAACAKLGLEVTPPQGSSWHSQHMVCAAHDGVPYCLALNDYRGKLDESKVASSMKRREDIIRLHHQEVKAVYEHFTRLDEPVWAMCGGGLNRQVFFGNKEGYLAILYLTNENNEFFGTSEDDHDGKFTLVLQSSKARLFMREHVLTHPSIEVRAA